MPENGGRGIDITTSCFWVASSLLKVGSGSGGTPQYRCQCRGQRQAYVYEGSHDPLETVTPRPIAVLPVRTSRMHHASHDYHLSSNISLICLCCGTFLLPLNSCKYGSNMSPSARKSRAFKISSIEPGTGKPDSRSPGFNRQASRIPAGALATNNQRRVPSAGKS